MMQKSIRGVTHRKREVTNVKKTIAILLIVLVALTVVSSAEIATAATITPNAHPHKVCKWVHVWYWKKVWFTWHGKLYYKWLKAWRWVPVCKVVWHTTPTRTPYIPPAGGFGRGIDPTVLKNLANV